MIFLRNFQGQLLLNYYKLLQLLGCNFGDQKYITTKVKLLQLLKSCNRELQPGNPDLLKLKVENLKTNIEHALSDCF